MDIGKRDVQLPYIVFLTFVARDEGPSGSATTWVEVRQMGKRSETLVSTLEKAPSYAS
jgi:hypothetical protein